MPRKRMVRPRSLDRPALGGHVLKGSGHGEKPRPRPVQWPQAKGKDWQRWRPPHLGDIALADPDALNRAIGHALDEYRRCKALARQARDRGRAARALRHRREGREALRMAYRWARAMGASPIRAEPPKPKAQPLRSLPATPPGADVFDKAAAARKWRARVGERVWV